jgi:hypothetical protein
MDADRKAIDVCGLGMHSLSIPALDVPSEPRSRGAVVDRSGAVHAVCARYAADDSRSRHSSAPSTIYTIYKQDNTSKTRQDWAGSDGLSLALTSQVTDGLTDRILYCDHGPRCILLAAWKRSYLCYGKLRLSELYLLKASALWRSNA